MQKPKSSPTWIAATFAALFLTPSCAPPDDATQACRRALERTIELGVGHAEDATTSAAIAVHRAQVSAAVGPRFLRGCEQMSEDLRRRFTECIDKASSARNAEDCRRQQVAVAR